MLGIILLVAAFVLFVLAAIPIPSRIGLGWAGMACVAAYWLFVGHTGLLH